jgi:hypothetical protein
MVMKVRSMLILGLILMFTSCEDAIDSPLATQEVDLIVVDGILTNENINHRITLTRPYKTQNENPMPVSGALVRIFEGGDPVTLIEVPAGSGHYYTPKRRAVSLKKYSLWIRYQGKEYFAQDTSVPVEPLPAIDLQKINDRYRIAFNKSGQDPNFVTYDISWKNTSECNSELPCEGRIVHYDLKTIDVNEFFKPKTADFDFPRQSIIIRKKYSVSEAYKVFLRSMLSETEWRGGVFDVQRANVVTNLSAGAAGFFAVSTVVSDTVVVQ